MKELLFAYWNDLLSILLNKNILISLLEIFLVYILVYYILLGLKGKRAGRSILGLLILIIAYIISKIIQLQVITWIFDQFFNYFALVILILFREDVQRLLTRLSINIMSTEAFSEEEQTSFNQIVKAVGALSASKIGALIVITGKANLQDHIQVGTPIDSMVVEELIYSLFLPYSPLHDGALIIHQNRIERAGCFLPLTQNPSISKNLGTRHRAAIGLSETTDAIVIVVSETDGKISLCYDGAIQRGIDTSHLYNELLKFRAKPSQTKSQKKPTTDPKKPTTDPKRPTSANTRTVTVSNPTPHSSPAYQGDKTSSSK